MPKKKTALTIEERLQQALVPAEEQPYEVPENWVWVRLLSTFINKTDSKKKIQQKSYLNTGDYAVVDQGQNLIGGYTDDASLQYDGELPVVVFGDHTRCVKYIDFKFVQGADGVKILLPVKSYDSKFFYYAIMNLNIPNMGYRRHFPLFDKLSLPLPPLSEQQRIVERIEELFAKLDEAKERLQEVADSFAVRKAAILHKAFTGELTKQWRRKNGVSDESWEEKKLGEVGSWLGGGTPSTSREEYWENGNILWITSKDMKSTVIEDTLMKVNEIGVKNSSANYIEKPALLVVMRSGILRRTFPVAIVKQPFTVNQDLKAIIPDEDDLEFLYWMLLSNEQRILNTCMKNGTTVESINSNALKNLTFKCPSLPEQHEIVRLIDDLLARERVAQQAAEQALASIDLMKKSILARAFRGELGTNKASEASALELLRQVLAEN